MVQKKSLINNIAPTKKSVLASTLPAPITDAKSVLKAPLSKKAMSKVVASRVAVSKIMVSKVAVSKRAF